MVGEGRSWAWIPRSSGDRAMIPWVQRALQSIRGCKLPEKGARGPGGDLVRGRGPGAPLPRAASSERLLSSSSGSGTRRDGTGRSMGQAGSGGGQRHGGQRLHALARPGQPTRGSCAPRSIIPPGGGAAGAGPAGTLPPTLRSWSTPPPRLSCRDAGRAQSSERCHPPTGGKSREKCLT